jgi:probable O-glycosylation ligase (exosortase A-associated)
MRDFLLLAGVILCAVSALRRPVVGLLAFVCLGYLNLNSMTWGVGRDLPFAQLTGGSTILGFLFGSESKKFPQQREFFFLLGLWVTFAFSTLFAIYPDIAAERLFSISKILLMVVFTIFLINTERRALWLLRAIALPLGFYGLKAGIFVVATGGNYMVLGPENSFIESNNAMGLALAMNVPLLFYLAKLETDQKLRRIINAMMIFSYPAVICTFSRGAWLGLLTVTVVLLLKSKHKVLVMATTGILATVLVPTLPGLLPERVLSRYDDLTNYQEESSAQSRFWNWEFCERVGLARPLTGGGFDYYSIETYAAYFPEFLARWPGKVWNCHSAWFTVFGEHGFPGFVFLTFLIGSCFSSLLRIRRYGRAHKNMGWVTHYADMIQVSLVGWGTVGTFYDAAYFDLFYYLIAFVVILKEIIGSALTGTPIRTPS